MDLNIEVHVKGGMLGLIDKKVLDTVNISAGESISMSTGLLLGLGSIIIIVTVDNMKETFDGKQLFIFSIVN